MAESELDYIPPERAGELASPEEEAAMSGDEDVDSEAEEEGEAFSSAVCLIVFLCRYLPQRARG